MSMPHVLWVPCVCMRALPMPVIELAAQVSYSVASANLIYQPQMNIVPMPHRIALWAKRRSVQGLNGWCSAGSGTGSCAPPCTAQLPPDPVPAPPNLTKLDIPTHLQPLPPNPPNPRQISSLNESKTKDRASTRS